MYKSAFGDMFDIYVVIKVSIKNQKDNLSKNRTATVLINLHFFSILFSSFLPFSFLFPPVSFLKLSTVSLTFSEVLSELISPS